jgi:tight adherence protein C
MTLRWVIPLLAIAWLGVALVLGEVSWFRRSSLPARLARFTPAAPGRIATGAEGRRTLSQVLGPIAGDLAERISRLAGITMPVAERLARAGRDDDVEAFRVGQFVQALAGTAAASAASVVLGIGPVLSVGLAAGGGVLAALLSEHRLDRAVAERQGRRRREVPVVVEQLGILLAAGWSVTGAISRVAERGKGVVADDLRSVVLRVRSGATEADALAVWSESADLPAVRRLVGVLGMHREATDLGALIAGEARAAREECHRDLLETIERRAQLVWVPVTVATLVPGLVLLAVPFVGAISAVTGG